MRHGLVLVLALLTLAACAYSGPRLVPSRWQRPPSSSAEVRRSIAAALEGGDRRAVTLGMMNLSRMGASLSPETQARLAPLLDRSALPGTWRPGGPLVEAFAHNFRGNAAVEERSNLFAQVPAEHRLIEGIAWDGARRRLFVGSVIDRRLLVQDGASWTAVATAAPIGGVFGMAVDGDRRLLWLASAPAEPMAQPETAFSGLVAVDLDRLEEARRIAIPGARLGDVALAPDGTLYASDGQSGAIYRCRPGCTEAETLIPPGILRSPQGIAVWPRGRVLIIADYALGLLRVDLRSLRIAPMIVREPQMLDGIDGLIYHDERLVAIQNGTRPRRIVTIRLSRDARIVEAVRLAERGPPERGEPTLGTMVDGTLVYVADAQWERYGSGGRLTDGGAPRATAIRQVQDVFDEPIIITTLRPIPPVPSLASHRRRA